MTYNCFTINKTRKEIIHMDERKGTETMIAVENKQETIELENLLKQLSPDEQKSFQIFMQGVRFAKNVAKTGS